MRTPGPGRGRIEDRRGRRAPLPIMTPLQRLTPEVEDTRDPVPPPIPSRARAALLPRRPIVLSPREKRALLHYISIRYQQALTPPPAAPRRAGTSRGR
jgi:hypothetical protein